MHGSKSERFMIQPFEWGVHEIANCLVRSPQEGSQILFYFTNLEKVHKIIHEFSETKSDFEKSSCILKTFMNMKNDNEFEKYHRFWKLI